MLPKHFILECWAEFKPEFEKSTDPTDAKVCGHVNDFLKTDLFKSEASFQLPLVEMLLQSIANYKQTSTSAKFIAKLKTWSPEEKVDSTQYALQMMSRPERTLSESGITRITELIQTADKLSLSELFHKIHEALITHVNLQKKYAEQLNRYYVMLYKPLRNGSSIDLTDTINEPPHLPYSALTLEVMFNRINEVKKLLERNAFFSTRQGDASSPLYWAIRNDNDDILDLLLTHLAHRYEFTSSIARNFLTLALRLGHVKIAERLLEAGTKAYHVDYAIGVEKGNVQLVKLISTYCEQPPDYTTLSKAIFSKNLACIEILAKKMGGPLLNERKYHYDKTLLLLAAETDSQAIVNVLLTCGADLNYKIIPEQHTVLDALINSKIDHCEMIRFLMTTHGALVNWNHITATSDERKKFLLDLQLTLFSAKLEETIKVKNGDSLTLMKLTLNYATRLQDCSNQSVQPDFLDQDAMIFLHPVLNGCYQQAIKLYAKKQLEEKKEPQRTVSLSASS